MISNNLIFNQKYWVHGPLRAVFLLSSFRGSIGFAACTHFFTSNFNVYAKPIEKNQKTLTYGIHVQVVQTLILTI